MMSPVQRQMLPRNPRLLLHTFAFHQRQQEKPTGADHGGCRPCQDRGGVWSLAPAVLETRGGLGGREKLLGWVNPVRIKAAVDLVTARGQSAESFFVPKAS